MKRKYRRPGQIVKLLRQAEAKLAEGQTIDEMCGQLGISDGTYYYLRNLHPPNSPIPRFYITVQK